MALFRIGAKLDFPASHFDCQRTRLNFSKTFGIFEPDSCFYRRFKLQFILKCELLSFNKQNQLKFGAFVTLADMKPGQHGRVTAIEVNQTSIVRLMVLGLVEDVPVRIENIAIGGDPIELSVYGSSISIRKQDARQFTVMLDPSHG